MPNLVLLGLWNLLVLSGCAFVLVRGVDTFVKSSSKIAHHLGVSKYSISIILIALATSLPETVIGINSALLGKQSLSMGNVIGANILMLTLVAGIPAILFKSIPAREAIKNRDEVLAVIFALLAFAFAWDGTISRMDGIALLGCYVLYTTFKMIKSHGIERFMEKFDKVNFWKEWMFFGISCAVILISSRVMVDRVLELGNLMGLGLVALGATITSLGTTTPELTFSIRTAKSRAKEGIIGNILGTIIVNSAFVLGVVSIINPISTNETGALLLQIGFFIFVLFVFMYSALTKEKIERREGILLVLTYTLFAVMELTGGFSYLSGLLNLN